ncbi:MAG TPA: ATP-binding protein [Steroidobacteraceae bacterium]|jgi:PAS domain S-box-containing protein
MSVLEPTRTLEHENAELRERLAEAEGVIQAIRQGDIDAVVVSGADGDRVFTLEGSDHPYRTLVESMNEGAATLSEDGIILYSNPRLGTLLGTSPEKLAGTRLASWLLPAEAARFEQLLRQCRDGFVSGDFDLRGREGEPLPVQVSLSSLSVQGVRCCCAVITDLSLAKHHAALAEAAEYVRQVNDRLREADRRKDEFLATLAHELRNPLAPIRAAAYVLKKLKSDDVRLTQARDMIERQAAHMTRLIDDLLEMSRITKGKIELQPHSESLAGVIASVAEAAQAAMEAREHEFVVKLPDDPLLIVADRIRISQAIFNVIENAAKYTRPGGHVLLRASREGSDAVITVKDDGIGIAPGMTAKIFEMFVQADGGGRRAQGGLGIGLALSKKLIEMHRGTISVSSRGLGQGAEFTIRLPLSANELPRAAAETEADLSPAATARRVLIVDDNIDAADSLCALLTISGHTVKSVYRGADALREITQFKPDVVLLDIGLPDVDGYEVARRARLQCGAHCPTLVALSGWGQEEDKEHAREAGIDVHLTKPVDAATLTRVLSNSSPLS